MKIRISIADDHLILSEALKITLEIDDVFEVIDISTNSRDTINNLKSFVPDILLLDLSMPEEGKESTNLITGLNVLEYVVSEKLEVKVIVLSNYSELSFVQSALKKGAKGYILKNENPEVLKSCILEVYKGKTSFSKVIEKKLLIGIVEDSEEGIPIKISKREKEILKLISLGYTSGDIAKYLKLHKDTVSDYREVLMEKLGAKNAPELIRIAYQWKILSLD